MAYIFDASQEIEKTMSKATQGVASYFSNIISQKKEDLEAAKSVYNNIYQLKKDINVYGKDVVNKEIDDLLASAKNDIFVNGAINPVKMRELQLKISDIKDIKEGFDDKEELIKPLLEVAAKSDLSVPFSQFYNKAISIVQDKNIKAGDLPKRFNDLMVESQDYNKATIKALQSDGAYTKKAGIPFIGKDIEENDYYVDVTSAPGIIVEVVDGQAIKKADDTYNWSAETQRLKELNPSLIENYKSAHSLSTSFYPDDESIVKQMYLDATSEPVISKTFTSMQKKIEKKRLDKLNKGEEGPEFKLSEGDKDDLALYNFVNELVSNIKSGGTKAEWVNLLRENIPPVEGVKQTLKIREDGSGFVISAEYKDSDGTVKTINKSYRLTPEDIVSFLGYDAVNYTSGRKIYEKMNPNENVQGSVSDERYDNNIPQED